MKISRQILLGSAMLASCGLALAQEANRRVEAMSVSANLAVESVTAQLPLQDPVDPARSSITGPRKNGTFKSMPSSPAAVGALPVKPTVTSVSIFGTPTARSPEGPSPGIIRAPPPTPRADFEWWNHKSSEKVERDAATFSNFLLPVFQPLPSTFHSRRLEINPQPLNEQNVLTRKIRGRRAASKNQPFRKQVIPGFGSGDMLKPPGTKHP